MLPTIAPLKKSLLATADVLSMDSTVLPEVTYQAPAQPDVALLQESYLAIGYAERHGASELTIRELRLVHASIRGSFRR